MPWDAISALFSSSLQIRDYTAPNRRRMYARYPLIKIINGDPDIERRGAND